MLKDSELRIILKRRFKGEGDYDKFNKFIADVKWSNPNYYCKSNKCAGGKSKNKEFELPKNSEKYISFSRKCVVCKNVESPTSNTMLQGVNYLPALIETIYIICQLQKKENRRINTEGIKDLLLSHGNRISDSTIEKYRFWIQNLFQEGELDFHKSRKIYGIEKFSLGEGKTKKWIYVLSQLYFPRQIIVKVYTNDNYSSLYNFLPRDFIKNSEKIILFDWGKTYPPFIEKYPQLKFTKGDVELRRSVSEVSVRLKEWLTDGKLYNSPLLALHIKECTNVLFQDYFTPVQILKYMIGTNLGGVK